jgi:hypothetical protein
MPKTAPKPQLTAVTALNPWCWVMGAIADWLTATGTDATAIVAIGAAVVAYWAVRESRQLREDQAQCHLA